MCLNKEDIVHFDSWNLTVFSLRERKMWIQMLIVASSNTGFVRSDEPDYLMTTIMIMIMKTTIIDNKRGLPVLDYFGGEVQMEITSTCYKGCLLPLVAVKFAVRHFCSRLWMQLLLVTALALAGM